MADEKFAILLLAPEETPDGRGRLLHAFTTARDLAVSGAHVEFFFEGIGVECLTAFHAKANPFSAHYVKLFDEVKPFAKACGVCCRHFGAADAADALGVEQTGIEHHDSAARFLLEGYRVVTF